jgi:hypothetical protein
VLEKSWEVLSTSGKDGPLDHLMSNNAWWITNQSH